MMGQQGQPQPFTPEEEAKIPRYREGSLSPYMGPWGEKPKFAKQPSLSPDREMFKGKQGAPTGEGGETSIQKLWRKLFGSEMPEGTEEEAMPARRGRDLEGMSKEPPAAPVKATDRIMYQRR